MMKKVGQFRPLNTKSPPLVPVARGFFSRLDRHDYLSLSMVQPIRQDNGS